MGLCWRRGCGFECLLWVVGHTVVGLLIFCPLKTYVYTFLNVVLFADVVLSTFVCIKASQQGQLRGYKLPVPIYMATVLPFIISLGLVTREYFLLSVLYMVASTLDVVTHLVCNETIT